MRTLTHLLLSLLTLAAFLWAAWQGYVLLTSEQRSLDPGMQSVLIIVAVLALVCTYMVNTALRKASLNIAQGVKKAELYEQFMMVWLAGQEDKAAITARMTLLAAQPVLKALNALLNVYRSEGKNSVKTKAAFVTLLVAMRTDLGYTGFNIQNELSKTLNYTN